MSGRAIVVLMAMAALTLVVSIAALFANKARAAEYQGQPDEAAWMADLTMQIAQQEDVPTQIALAIVFTESRFNPTKRGKAGEIGLMQLKCSTARVYGFEGKCDELTFPVVNLTFGMRHLRDALVRGAGFHQSGLNARGVSDAYVEKVRKAMRAIPR